MGLWVTDVWEQMGLWVKEQTSRDGCVCYDFFSLS